MQSIIKVMELLKERFKIDNTLIIYKVCKMFVGKIFSN